MSAAPRRKAAPTEKDIAEDALPPGHALKAVAGSKTRASLAAEAIPDLDKVIHERARLAIVGALATSASLTHNELREILALTDGNLSVHARRLEEAGYITCEKDFAGRTPRTTYTLSPEGKAAFERYLSHMEALILAMKGL
ncbi:MAG: transcriptional regulator [Gemmatimonadota bacterium]|nr:transcriptional regulator [Gemmatimonadota bacterium]